jgi:hypothetical protein
MVDSVGRLPVYIMNFGSQLRKGEQLGNIKGTSSKGTSSKGTSSKGYEEREGKNRNVTFLTSTYPECATTTGTAISTYSLSFGRAWILSSKFQRQSS